MNLLFLLTDNQRADLLGCAGNRIIQTPHIDGLAARGTRFSNAFATTPICAASRASFLTGLYERRHQFTFHAPPLRTEFTDNSYPTLLKSAGYRTGFIGKFGIASNGPEPSLEDPEALGKMFDHFDNYEHWTDDGYEIRKSDGNSRHLTDITGDKVIGFLENHRHESPNQPFCLSVSFNAPHAQDGDPRHFVWPESEDDLYEDNLIPEPANADPAFFESLPSFIQKSESRVRWHTRYDTSENYQRNLKGLYRMVTGIDRNVGRILDSLRCLSLLDNTVILFASDHGMYYGERGLSDCWQLNEESIRIPLIICDPREESVGSVKDELALNIDVAPTILDLCGVSIPKSTQGNSLRPLIRNLETDWRSAFFSEHLFDRRNIPKSEGVRTRQWKYIRYFEQTPVHEELYDLVSDPHETHNLAGRMAFTENLNEMRVRCDDLRSKAE
jgi:arylsulfatase A-like enzyme